MKGDGTENARNLFRSFSTSAPDVAALISCHTRASPITNALHNAGDYTPDLKALLAADIIIATPEKWDGISRNWQTRG